MNAKKNLALVLALCMVLGTMGFTAFAEDKTITTFAELEAAISVATDGDTITLLNDIQVEDTITIETDKNITLNLNGKTISQEKECNGNYSMIVNKGTLVIEDSVGVGKISFKDTGNGDAGYGWGTYTINNSGNLTVNSGTIENTTIISKHMYDAIDNNTTQGRNAILTVNGGKISNSGYFAIRMFCGSTTYENKVVINGGEIYGGNEKVGAVWLQNANNSASRASLTVGGTSSLNGVYLSGGDCTNIELNINTDNLEGTPDKILGSVGDDFTLIEKNGVVCVDAILITGEGTQENPYGISNAEELKLFRDNVNSGNTYSGKIVKLEDDIDLDNEEWTPIGNSTNTFKGIFDGNNKTILNLTITGNESYAGLFGFTTNGEIKNLTVENAMVSGRLNVGVVAGTPYTSKYTNIKVKGHVEVNGMAYVGGVGGKNAYANWKDITVDVDDTSYVKANSVENGTANRTYVGGVIGFMGEGSHSLENITSNIKVIGSTCDIGGIVGIAHYGNNFKNVICLADVYGEDANETEIGGIAGVWYNQSGYTVTFDSCQHTGKVYIANQEVNVPISGPAYNNTGNGELKASVAKVGDNFYWTIADAVEAVNSATDDVTITIITDYSGSDATTITTDKNVVIDLAGKALTLNQIKIAKGATVEIKNGRVIGNSVDYDTINSNGNLTLTNVNADGKRHIIRAKSGVVTINGGTYTAASVAGGTRHAINVGDDEAPDINVATLTINDGTFCGPRETDSDSGSALLVQTGSSATIFGGNFSKGLNNTLATQEGASLTIKGGTFDQDPSNYVAEGYRADKYAEEELWNVARLYTLTFNTNGGSEISDITETESSVISLSEYIPQKNGYFFGGWYSEAELTNKLTEITLTEDTTVYAKWRRNSSNGGSSGITQKYTVVFETNNGTKLDKISVKYGTATDLSEYIPQREGYVFAGWYSDKELTKPITEIINSANTTVYAGWEKANDKASAAKPNILTDKHYAYIVGREDARIEPKNNITRAEVATIIYRLLSEEERNKAETNENIFVDVNENDWFNTAVSTLAGLELITGRTTDTYAPSAFITRAELVTVFARMTDISYDGDAMFDDVSGHWAEDYINRATCIGWIVGDNGLFRPDDNMRRAEAITLINRVLGRQPESIDDILIDKMVKFEDNADENAWYYLAIQEAANSHNYEMKEDGKHEKWTELTDNLSQSKTE